MRATDAARHGIPDAGARGRCSSPCGQVDHQSSAESPRRRSPAAGRGRSTRCARVMDLPVLECLRAFDPEPPRLERPQSAAMTTISRRIACQPRFRGRKRRRRASAAPRPASPRWNCGSKGLICCMRRSTSSVRRRSASRDVVDRFVRIQLGALSPGVSERIDDARLDAEQPEFKDLEEAGGSAPMMTAWRRSLARDRCGGDSVDVNVTLRNVGRPERTF